MPSGAPSFPESPGITRPTRTRERDGAAGEAVVPVHPPDGVPHGEAHGAVLDALPAPRLLRHHLAQHVPAGDRSVSQAGPAQPGAGPCALPVLEANHGRGAPGGQAPRAGTARSPRARLPQPTLGWQGRGRGSTSGRGRLRARARCGLTPGLAGGACRSPPPPRALRVGARAARGWGRLAAEGGSRLGAARA